MTRLPISRFPTSPQLLVATWLLVAATTAMEAQAQNGACCLGDGSCTETDQMDCEEGLVGVFHGAGTTCAGTTCLVGGCCKTDGSCEVTNTAICSYVSGEYRGDGTDCTGAVCTGACCMLDGSCTEGSANACYPGDYQGAGTSCDDGCPEPLGTEFTYQGQLKQIGMPLTGTVDLEASLWTAAQDGNKVGGTLLLSEVDVAKGLFTVKMDFGADVFDGKARYLKMDVRSPHDPTDTQPFTQVTPLQPVTATPYAIQTRGLFVDDALNVGIGTTSPVARLHVVTSAGSGAASYVENISGMGPAVVMRANTPGSPTLDVGALATSGTNYVIRAHTNSPDGYGAYFTGPSGSKNYFERSVGIGTESPSYPLHVETDDPTDFAAIYARAAGYDGRSAAVVGVHSSASEIGGAGVQGVSEGDSGSGAGVYGQSYRTSGTGVAGVTWASSGETKAVTGYVASSNGYGAYFVGAEGSKNYFEQAVGIGTDSPDAGAKLHIVGGTEVHETGGGGLVVEGLTGNQLAFDGNEIQARNGGGGSGTAIPLRLNVDGGDVTLAENGAGNVGIGADPTPNERLRVETNGDPYAVYAKNTASGASFGILAANESTGGVAIKGYASASSGVTRGVWGDVDSPEGVAGYFTGPAGSWNYFQRNVGIGTLNPNVKLDVTGNIEYTGTITDVSDIRLKENITPVIGALAMVRRLDGVYFNMKDTPDEREVGLIAQNVQEVLPDAVHVVDPKIGYLGVSYPSLIPVLVEAIKEMQSDSECRLAERDRELQTRADQIARLETQNAELSSRLERIERILSSKNTHEAGSKSPGS